jgi:hypothetical protein
MADPDSAAMADRSPATGEPQDAPDSDELTDHDVELAVRQADNPDKVRDLISRASRRARQAEVRARDARQKAADADQLRVRVAELEEAGKSELEKLQARAERAEAHAAELERAQLIRSLAAKYGIPETHADRLRGATEAELEADAKAYAKSFPTADEPPPDLGGGARSGAATAPGTRGFSDQLRRQAQRRR